MTVYSNLVLTAIGTGYRLRVPHDGSPVTLVDSGSDNPKAAGLSPHHMVRPEIGPLDRDSVEELLASNLLHLMAKNWVGQRVGWIVMGLDGTKADFYSLRQ